MPRRASVPALLLALLVLPLAGLRAGDAPTDAEWSPIAAALVAGTQGSITDAERLLQRYPQWPDGFRALALAKLQSGDARGAWSAARQALIINSADADAGAIGVQALAAQVVAHDLLSNGKERAWPDVFAVADKFTDATDAGGKVAAQAAVAALRMGDQGLLAKYLDAVKARSGGAPNPVIDFIAAKQALGAKDLAGAIAALERAIAARPDYHDALYELGRVHIVAAMADPGSADGHYAKAAEAFTAAAKLDIKDAGSRFGLGRVRLEQGKRLAAAGNADDAGASFRKALAALDEGLQLEPRELNGKLWKGDALLRLERWEEAVPMLQQALAGGIEDRALPFNLALALTKAGRPGAAAEVLGEVKAESSDEQLTMAMNAFHQGNWVAAADMLVKGMQSLSDPAQLPQYLAAERYYAHCQRELAKASKDPSEAAEHMKAALDSYLDAGERGDFPSRHWWLALKTQAGPDQAFAAGKQILHWDGWLAMDAWRLLLGNYGWHITQGQGFAGLIAHGAAHLMLWSLITMILMMLFLKGLVMPMMKPPAPARASAGAKPGTASARRPGGAAAAKASAATRAGAAAGGAKRPPSRASAKPPSAGPGSGGAKTPFSE